MSCIGCEDRRVVEGSGVGIAGYVVHVEVHGELGVSSVAAI